MPTVFETLQENYIEFDNKRVQVIWDNDDGYWFNLKDTIKLLGYKDPTSVSKKEMVKQYIKPLSEIDTTTKGSSNTRYVKEPGFYFTGMKSKFARNESFIAFMFEKVRPGITAHYRYLYKKQLEDSIPIIKESLKNLQKEIECMIENSCEETIEGIVYAIDVSTESIEQYKICRTSDPGEMNQILGSYNPESDIIILRETSYPLEVEKRSKEHLHKFRCEDDENVYQCPGSILYDMIANCYTIIELTHCQQDEEMKARSEKIGTELGELRDELKQLA